MSLKIDRIQIEIEINNDKSRLRAHELETDLKKLRRELKKLPEGTDEYVKKSAELKKVQLEYDKIIDKIGLAGMSMKQLRARQRELNLLVANMSPKSKSYTKLRGELDKVNARMKVLRGNAQATGLSVGKIADGFNKYFGMIGMFAASFTGVVMGFRQLVDVANEYNASVADLSAITGLAGDELDWLSDKAKELTESGTQTGIAITASAQDIVDSYKLMGSAKPELLKNKEALNEVTESALIMADAAGMKAPDAISALADTMNQFNAPAEESVRYINAIAAGSKEGAAAIPSISSSIVKFGAAAAQSNISVESSIGLIETLAEKGIKGELAGTGLKNVLLTLATSADKKLNPKLVGINGALEELANRNMSAAEMTKMFGKENYIAAQILVSNHDSVVKYTEAVTDTSVAMEQAAINTETSKAKLERAKNAFQLVAIELGEKLAPALTFSTNGFSYLMKAMVAGIEVWKEHKTLITSAALGIGVYTAAVKASVVWDKAKVFWNEKIIASMGKIQKLNRTQIWGLVAAGITMAVGALIEYKNNLDSITTKMEEYNSLIAKGLGSMEAQFNWLKKTTKGSIERKKAIEDINREYGEYLPHLLSEKSSLEEIEKAQKSANEELKKAIIYKQNLKRSTEIATEAIEAEKQILDKIRFASSDDEKLFKQQTKSISEITEGTKEYRLAMQQLNKEWNFSSAEAEFATRRYIKSLAAETKQKADLEEITKRLLGSSEEQSKTNDEIAEKEIDTTKKVTIVKTEASKSEAEEQRKLQKIIIDNMQESYAKRVAMENWRYEGIVASAEKEIEHEQIKNAILEQEALAHQRRLGDILASDIGDMPDAEDLNNDEGIDEDEEKELDDLAKKREKFLAQQRWEQEEYGKTAQAQKNILKDRLEKGLISQSEYNSSIKEIDKILLDWKLSHSAEAMGKMAALFQKESLAYKIFASGEAIIATYLGASKDLATGPPIVKYAMAAATIATGLANVAKINGVAFADGYYPVQTQNGMYNVAYGGSPTTQIVSSPKHFVAGEQGAAFPELIVDGPTFNHVRANFPEAIDAIMYSRNKVKGYADGYYPDSLSSGTASTNQVMDQLTQVMARVDNIFTRIDQEGVSVSYNKLDESQREVAEIEQNVTL